MVLNSLAILFLPVTFIISTQYHSNFTFHVHFITFNCKIQNMRSNKTPHPSLVILMEMCQKVAAKIECRGSSGTNIWMMVCWKYGYSKKCVEDQNLLGLLQDYLDTFL